MLEAQGIAYRATQYDATGAFHSAEEAASLAGAPLDAVYKTLVVLREGQTSRRPLLVMVPATAHIDLKVLARSTAAKKLRMATHREAEQRTGMQAGGISALGLRKPGFEIMIDERARSSNVYTLAPACAASSWSFASRTWCG